MFKRLKEKIGKKQLGKVLRRRKHKAFAVNFSDVRSLGVIYPANEESGFRQVKKLVEALPREIKVSTLGYSDSKELKEFHIQPEGFRFFCHADLNWYFRPVSDTVREFISTPFDVLIDLSKEEVLPINFVVADSHARLITGRYKENANYDFMIMPGEDQRDTYLFEQIIRYLKMIKTV